jgi:Flp pilus assembly protein CpaB
MNRKFNPLLAVGAVLLVVGIAVLGVLASRNDGGGSSTVKALVATTNIAQGAAAAPTTLKLQDVKSRDLPAGAVTSLQQVAGQIALVPIVKGSVITTSSFGQYGATTGTGVSLPKGKEALGIELGFAPGALRYVIPGNRVTIWVTPKQKANADGTIPVVRSVPLLENVLVLRTTPGAGNGDGTAAVAGPGQLDFLLALDRLEASRLIGAAAQPDINLLYVTLSSTSTS